MSMYLRLKRKNQTVFLLVEPSDNFLSVKQKVADYFKLQANQVALYSTTDKKKEYIDMGTVSDHELKNDDIIYFVFAKESGSGFEDIAVESFTTGDKIEASTN